MSSKPQFRDLSGQRFGRLLVQEYEPRTKKDGGSKWRCLCDCGQTAYVAAFNLANGSTNSCGCYTAADRRRERRNNRKTIALADKTSFTLKGSW